ncbi:MAG: hypothetical protein VB143_09145 [Burkholderia sp.]
MNKGTTSSSRLICATTPATPFISFAPAARRDFWPALARADSGLGWPQRRRGPPRLPSGRHGGAMPLVYPRQLRDNAPAHLPGAPP